MPKPLIHRETVANLLLSQAMLECPETHLIVSLFIEAIFDANSAIIGAHTRTWLRSRYAARLANLVGLDIQLLIEMPEKIVVAG